MTAVVKNMDRAMADMNLERVRLSQRFLLAIKLTYFLRADLHGHGQV